MGTMNGKFDKCIAVLEISDSFAHTSEPEYEPVEAYTSIELALNALYDEYVSAASDAKLYGELEYANIDKSVLGEFYFHIVRKDTWTEERHVWGRVTTIDLITE